MQRIRGMSDDDNMERLPSSDDEEMGEEELTGLAAKSTFALNFLSIYIGPMNSN